MSEDRSGSSNDQQKSWFERLAQAFHDEPRSRQDIIELLQTAVKSEVIDRDAFSIAEGALAVSEVQARDIMIPPSQMVVIKSEDDPKTSIRKVIDSSHSRFPVVGKTRMRFLASCSQKTYCLCCLKTATSPSKTFWIAYVQRTLSLKVNA